MNNTKIKFNWHWLGYLLIPLGMIGNGLFGFSSEYSWLVKTLSVASEVLLLAIAINQFYDKPIPIHHGPIYLVVANALVSWLAWTVEVEAYSPSEIGIAWLYVGIFAVYSVLWTMILLAKPRRNNSNTTSSWGGSRPMNYYRGRDDGSDGGWWGGDSGGSSGGGGSCGGD